MTTSSISYFVLPHTCAISSLTICVTPALVEEASFGDNSDATDNARAGSILHFELIGRVA